MLMKNSSVVTSTYLDRNVVETFDNKRHLCFANSFIVANITSSEIKRGVSAATGSVFASRLSFVVTSVYLDGINLMLLAATGGAFSTPT